MPQDPPDDGTTTTIEEVVIIGNRHLQPYRVEPPLEDLDDDDGPIEPDTPTIGGQDGSGGELTEECRRQAALHRAVLHAMDLIGSDGKGVGLSPGQNG